MDDVKRELLTGKFSKMVAQWDVLTFMSIGAFDDKDRFEFLCAVDLSLSVIDSQTVPLKMRCVQGHQKKFLEGHDPSIGASRVFCLEERKELFAARLTEYGNNGMPKRMYHRTSATAALEILRHGLIPGGVGVTESGKKHCYLSPYQLSETSYKSGVRADQPYEIAFDTELALRSAVDLTMTSSEALITSQHIPNSPAFFGSKTPVMELSSSLLPKRTNAKSTARQSMQESSLPTLSDQLLPQVLHHEMKFLRKRMDERKLLM